MSETSHLSERSSEAEATQVVGQRQIKRRHIWVTLVLVVVLGGVIAVLGKGLNYDPQVVPSALIGKPAAPFSLKPLQGMEFIDTTSGKPLTLAMLRGKPVVLNFWASWCYSCRDEARDLEVFWQKYRERGLLVVGVAIQDTPEAAMGFARTYGDSYPLALDEDGKAAIDYGVTGVPETFFIDRQGVIQHKEAQPLTAQQLETWTSKIM